MKRQQILLLMTVVIGLMAASPAQAQRGNNPARSYGVGVGVGVGVGPRGYGYPYYGPGFGIYPYDYRGFYGNGVSMYGPPVPTYGIVPGTFGASDNRVNQNAPFFGTGMGWWGYRSPSPRPTPNFAFNPPATRIDANGNIVTDVPDQGVLSIEVIVPIENAFVFINDQLTKQTGTSRVFTSPMIQKDEVCEYDVRAEWIIDGKKTSLTQTVSGKPGQRVVADFVK
ncbi:MAG: TIGR03000 domain-containing protein [Planctomycetes bacterium]|nr:TIGR03000 domain-containing protein [Planctomycetota bacterium]